MGVVIVLDGYNRLMGPWEDYKEHEENYQLRTMTGWLQGVSRNTFQFAKALPPPGPVVRSHLVLR